MSQKFQALRDELNSLITHNRRGRVTKPGIVTQTDVANLAEVNQVVVNKFLRGRSGVSVETFFKLSEAAKKLRWDFENK